MTKAPATPELVERLNAMASMPHVRFHYRDDVVMVKQAAAALEAQQARIAELEAVLTLARDFAETEVEMRGAAGSDMSDYQNEAQEVVDAIDQALSSQGRHEGGERGLPESPGVNAVPLPASPDGLDPKNWEVEVRIDGERVLTIGHSHLSGIEDIDRYGDTVRTCAEHLKSFIGSGEPEPCFGCGGSGKERWMGWNGEEDGPCSICQPELPPPSTTNPKAGATEHG